MVDKESNPDPYSDIRPFNDDEIAPVVEALLRDREFVSTMVGLTNPTALRWLPGIAIWWARRLLRREVAHVNSIYDFQMLVKPRLDHNLWRDIDIHGGRARGYICRSIPCIY